MEREGEEVMEEEEEKVMGGEEEVEEERAIWDKVRQGSSLIGPCPW